MEKEINNDFYDQLGDRWYQAQDDPVALLRSESRVKAPWVINEIKKVFGTKKDIRVLDVGCGAGFLSNQLAKSSYSVTGVDLSEDSLRVAAKYDSTGSVQYKVADANRLPFENSTFHVVSAMDFLEHVPNPQDIVAEISRVLVPDGLFFFHTFNRNILSYIVIIKFVEWLVKNTPPNMHVLDLFIKPREVMTFCENNTMKVRKMTGIRPCFSTLTWTDLIHRSVPKEFSFTLTKSLLLSYMGYAQKVPNPASCRTTVRAPGSISDLY